MVISTYQINSVLRVYGNQLRQGRLSSSQAGGSARRTPDTVTISAGDKRDAVIEKVTAEMMERIARNGPESQEEKAAFDTLEKKYGQKLIMSKNTSGEFEFKIIEDEGRSTRGMAAETSEELTDTLKKQLRATVNENMI